MSSNPASIDPDQTILLGSPITDPSPGTVPTVTVSRPPPSLGPDGPLDIQRLLDEHRMLQQQVQQQRAQLDEIAAKHITEMSTHPRPSALNPSQYDPLLSGFNITPSPPIGQRGPHVHADEQQSREQAAAAGRMRLSDAPEYRGGIDAAAVGWITSMDMFWRLHPHTTDQQRGAFALNRLRDAAAVWATQHDITHPDSITTWTGLRNEIRRRFVTVEMAEENRRRLYALRQGGRPVEQYIEQFMTLVAPISITDMPIVEQRRQFVQNLDPELRSFLDSFVNPHSLDDAITAARKREAAVTRGRGYVGAGATAAGQFPSTPATHRYNSNRPNNISAIPFQLTNTEVETETESKGPRWHADPAEPRESMQQTMKDLQVGLAALTAQIGNRGGQQRDRGQKIDSRRPGTTGQWQWPPKIEGVSPQQVQERADRGACFRCGQMGHMARACPSVRRSSPALPRSN